MVWNPFEAWSGHKPECDPFQDFLLKGMGRILTEKRKALQLQSKSVFLLDTLKIQMVQFYKFEQKKAALSLKGVFSLRKNPCISGVGDEASSPPNLKSSKSLLNMLILIFLMEMILIADPNRPTRPKWNPIHYMQQVS